MRRARIARRTLRAASTLLVAAQALTLACCYADARIGVDDLSDASGLDEVSASLDAPSGDAASSDRPDAAPAQLAGAYDLLIKGGFNGCALSTWTEGSVSSANVVLGQTDAAVQAEITGLAAVTFGLLTGTSKLEGTIVGAALSLRASGVTESSFDGGACPYTFDAEVNATVRADRLEEGVITYRRHFSDDAGCAAYACETLSSFVGLRNDVDP